MGKINWKLRRYYRQIKSFLPCSRKDKKRCLQDLKADVDIFLQQDPQADIQTVRDRFGTPRQIAAVFVEEMDTGLLLKRLRIRRRVVAIVMSAALIIAGIYTLYRAYGLHKINETFDGYIVDEIKVIE